MLVQARVEVGVLQLLNQRHDPEDRHHIVRMKDYFVHRKHLCIAFELLSVNLYDLIRHNRFRGISMNLLRVFLRQILSALVVMRDAKIIHCDLKPEVTDPAGGASPLMADRGFPSPLPAPLQTPPGSTPFRALPPQNVLLKSLNSGEVKVIDFGSACFEGRTVYSYIQSRFYRSPEVVLRHPYTAAIDMWSLGCMATELFLGLPLFPGSILASRSSRSRAKTSRFSSPCGDAATSGSADDLSCTVALHNRLLRLNRSGWPPCPLSEAVANHGRCQKGSLFLLTSCERSLSRRPLPLSPTQ